MFTYESFLNVDSHLLTCGHFEGTIVFFKCCLGKTTSSGSNESETTSDDMQ